MKVLLALLLSISGLCGIKEQRGTIVIHHPKSSFYSQFPPGGTKNKKKKKGGQALKQTRVTKDPNYKHQAGGEKKDTISYSVPTDKNKNHNYKQQLH